MPVFYTFCSGHFLTLSYSKNAASYVILRINFQMMDLDMLQFQQFGQTGNNTFIRPLIMNGSFSEDVLQKMRLQQRKLQFIRNPQKLLSNTVYGAKTHYIPSSHSPQPLIYNQIIHDGESKKKGRYKLRNTRQPNLKIIERKSLSKQKAHSLLGLKQLMKQEMERYSVKRRYENALVKYADNQVAQNLKLDLLFLPNAMKIPHRNRYRPNKQAQQLDNIISVNGNRILQTRDMKMEMMQVLGRVNQQIEQPDMPKKTAGYELKYRRYYLTKRMDIPIRHSEDKEQLKNSGKGSHRDEQLIPLTGWL